MQSEIFQSNTTGCNELERHPASYCNNTHEEQVISSGGKRSSSTERRRKFNPASIVNFETEHASTKLFPPRHLQSDTYQNNTAGCNDFQRRDRKSSRNNMQEKVVTCNDENKSSGDDQQRELIPALLPIFEFRQSGREVQYPPLNYQSDIHRHKTPTYNESRRISCHNATEEQASRVTSWNKTQRKEHTKSSHIDTNEYLVFCNGENRPNSENMPNGIARRSKFKPPSVACLDSHQVGLRVPFPPRSMQSDIVHSNTANRNGFQRKDDRASSHHTQEEQVHHRASRIERRRKFKSSFCGQR